MHADRNCCFYPRSSACICGLKTIHFRFPQPQSLYRMRQALLRGSQESKRVGQLRMMIEGRLIHPFGMDGEYQRLADRFEGADRQAAWLGARGLQHLPQRNAKLSLSSRLRFQTDDEVNAHTLRSFVTRPTSTHSTTKIFPA